MKTSTSQSQYVQDALLGRPDLQPYLRYSSVLFTGNDSKIVWDFMALIPDQLFEGAFKGKCFIETKDLSEEKNSIGCGMY